MTYNGYEIRFGPPEAKAEIDALLDDPRTSEDAGQLLGYIQAIARQGQAGRKIGAVGEGYERGLSIHRKDFRSCTVFYAYDTGGKPVLRLLGACRAAAALEHFKAMSLRLPFVA